MNTNMLSKIEKLIIEYFDMYAGEKIENYTEEIILKNDDLKIILKRKVLKHIVEKRKIDNYNLEKIIQIFKDIYDLLDNKQYKIIENLKNNDKNTKDFLFIEIITNKKEGVILSIEIIKLKENEYYIKTGFYRSISKIKKLLKE